MHGSFLQGLERIYHDIRMVVDINGKRGTAFRTCMGTKQGSELSPLLFGIFIEQFHKLLMMRADGAGPTVGNMRVPDILYADDVALLGHHDPSDLQALLDVLALFCTLFGMRVNIAKTKIVVFRRPRTPLGPCPWVFQGLPVPVVEQWEYLGVCVHATKPLHAPSVLEGRAQAGRKAMFALLAKCRRAHIQQTAFRCRLFDVLVRPALSYACHVWGADACQAHLATPSASPLERVHVLFLRMLAGVGDKVHHWSLFKEFHRQPILVHWAKLLVRFWNTMAALACDATAASRLLTQAFVGDVELMLHGCRTCWTFKVLDILTTLQLTTHHAWLPSHNNTVHTVTRLQFDEARVEQALQCMYDSVWHNLPMHPRTAPPEQVVACTYLRWVGVRPHGPAHLTQRIPFPLKQQLIRFRLGWHNLAIQAGRARRIPRNERTCLVCGRADAVEDMFHFLCECSMYNGIRVRYRVLFGGPNPVHALVHHGPLLPRAQLMCYIFNHPQQLTLARALTDMYTERKRLLSIPPGVPDPVSDRDGDVGVEYDTRLPALHELGPPHIREEISQLVSIHGAATAVSMLRAMAVTAMV